MSQQLFTQLRTLLRMSLTYMYITNSGCAAMFQEERTCCISDPYRMALDQTDSFKVLAEHP